MSGSVTRSGLRFFVVAILLVAIACGEQSPTRPLSEAVTAQGPVTQAALEAQINGLINALYAPTEQGTVRQQFARIKAQLASRRTTEAQASVVTFVQTLLADQAAGGLEDPNGAQPPSTTEALQSLANAVAQFGGLPAPIPPALGNDQAVAVVGPEGGTVVASSGFGGVVFPPGALPENTIVVVSRLPNPAQPNAGPLPTTFDQYPLFYDFSTTPHVAQFAQPVTVAICQLEVGAPFGPPTQTVADRLQLAHPNPANPSTLELLPREVVSFVDCDDVSLAQARQGQGEGILADALGTLRGLGTRALAPFRPTKLYAVHGGLGGKTTSFSPFGAVDPGPGSCATAPTGFATVSCFSFTTIPGVTHGFIVGSSISLVPSSGVLSADYVLLSPTGFTKLPPNTPMDVNQAQYLFQPELNETTGIWTDVLRIVTPANQPAQQILIQVIKPMTVGVCNTPMTGVAQTYPTMDLALPNVAPGGTIKVCPQTITVPGAFPIFGKAVTIEAETPSDKPQFLVNGPGVQFGFVVFGAPGPVVFRNLSFTLSGGAISAIDIGSVSGPTPWQEVLVENSVFNLQPNIGRAVRVFSTTLPNPKVTVQGNQMSGGTFPISSGTGSPTGTIEVLNNSITGPFGSAGFQNETNVRVEGNTFSGCGNTICITLLNVSNGLVRNNTMTVGFPSSMGIRFSRSSGTITQNTITGVGGVGSPSLESSYPMSGGGIAIVPIVFFDATAPSLSTVLVTQNTVSNAGAGIRIIGGGSSVTGANNVFSNVHSALRLDNTNATPSSLNITSSDFTTYFLPISFLGASPAPNTITATCNWWGSTSGPQNILAGTPLASYSPWATGPVANGAGGACPPSGNAIVYEFCNNDDPPLKFWRQSQGTWAEVPPTAGAGVTQFLFTISGSTGGIAYTRSITGANVQSALRTSKPRTSFGPLVNRQAHQKVADARARLTNQVAALTSPYINTFVMNALATEIESNRAICAVPNPPAPVSKTFTVSGMAPNETGTLGYGNVMTSLTPTTANYDVSVTPGTYDWMAAFGIPGTFPAGTNWTNYRIGRGETTAGGSVAINRTGAPAFVTMPFTITGGNPGSLYANSQSLTGANGSILALALDQIATTNNTGNLRFLAVNDRLASDLNVLSASNFELGTNVIGSRATIQYFGPNPPASATLALPQAVPAFTVTQVNGAPVTTWTASGQIPTDFQASTSLIDVFYTGAGESALYAHVATRGWLTANSMSTSYTLTGPTLPGFLPQWAPAAPLFEVQSAMITNFTTVPTAGASLSFSSRIVQNP